MEKMNIYLITFALIIWAVVFVAVKVRIWEIFFIFSFFLNLIYFQSAPGNQDENESPFDLQNLIVPPNVIPQQEEQVKKEEKKDEDVQLIYSWEYYQTNAVRIAEFPENARFGWHIMCRPLRIG